MLRNWLPWLGVGIQVGIVCALVVVGLWFLYRQP